MPRGEGRVRADAAVTINGLVRWTINHGRAGLEAWAGTPGTVGGAIFGNAHFGGRLIGVTTAIALLYVVAHQGMSWWWLLPVAVTALLALSLNNASRARQR